MAVNRRDLLRAGLLGGLGAAAAPAGAAADFGRIGHRNAHAACRDTRRGQVLLFGGADTSAVLGDLWRLRDGAWRQLSRDGPPARTFPAMAYDSRRDRAVLFGGNRVLFGTGGGDTMLDDHWEWDGRRWSRFEGARPPSRAEAACAFDPSSGLVLLFGGYRLADGARARLDDLWAFDGAAWRQLPGGGPGPRNGAAMVYDRSRREGIVAGGNAGARDAWAVGAAGWRRLPDLPLGRYNPAACFDEGAGCTLLFGGYSERVRIAGTCGFDGRQWRSFAGAEPPARNHAVLVEDDGGGALLIGGHDGDNVLGDVWRWSNGWRQLAALPPAPRVPNNH